MNIVPKHPEGWRFRDIQLELSLKPFHDPSPAGREAVIREIFEQWRALWRHAESISLMLWIAEGSEILEYDGNPDSTFEWARWHGAPNRHRWDTPLGKDGKPDPDHGGIGTNSEHLDPEGRGIHRRAYPYRPDAPQFTYRWLAELVSDMKRIGKEVTGKTVYVGETFDIGPEFSLSRFKYDWHREILGDGPIFKEQFITCEAVLNGDTRRYAGWPDGIPDQTRFGLFFGRQLRHLFEDCGFDFLWLSNGFGFSLEPWALVGEVFDGKNYHGDRSAGIRDRVLGFWRDLRSEFPNHYPIRTRGTNMATGIDIGSDASPLREIYDGDFAVDAPVNSPWAALDGDFGLELSGWMSHIARHPGETFRFRFYTHDPWWLNSPWLDRYGRQPHDIFLPLSVSRLEPDGSVEIPRDLAFLSVDDSYGGMPLQVPNEVTAHLLAARESAPDAPGPLVWVYPFDDMHDLHPPGVALHLDAYIGAALNQGLPLNTVCDIRDLPETLTGSILVTPVPPALSESEARILASLDTGNPLLLFGAIPEGSAFLSRLGLALADPIEGDFPLPDGRILRHTGFLSGGGMRECAPKDSGYMSVSRDGQRRCVRAQSENLAWVRASLTTAEFNPEDPRPIRGPILRPVDPATFASAGEDLREALKPFGWSVTPSLTPSTPKPPLLTIHRHANGFIFNGYFRDELAEIQISTPYGAPLPMGRYVPVENGASAISGETAMRREVRVFVERGEASVMRCFELTPGMHGVHRRILVEHAKHAHLVFFPQTGAPDFIRILRAPCFPYFVGEFVEPVWETTPHGPVIRIPDVNGSLLIEWGQKID